MDIKTKAKSSYIIKRVSILIIILAIVSSVIIIYYPNIWIFYNIKSQFSKSNTPWAYIVPADRNVDIPENNLEIYPTFSFDNLKLKVPWKNLKEKKEMENYLFLSFNSEHKKGVYINKSAFVGTDIIENLLGQDQLDAKKVEELLGGETLKNNYTIYNQSLSTTPHKVSIFGQRKELGRKVIMLMLKRIFTNYRVNKIYRFEINNFKGFQFGEPDTNKKVDIEIFHDMGKRNRLTILSANQDEVDFILSSIDFSS